MPRRTRCPQCQAVLNVPDGAEGRKLKCPKCGTKFRSSDEGASARSSIPGVDTARPASTSSSASSPVVPRPSEDEGDLPVLGGGDLREQLTPPLFHEQQDEPAPPRPAPPPEPPSPFAEAEAAGLLEDDEPAHRRPSAAELRAKTKRCPCGGVVPAGMSICPSCGLDLETGERSPTFDLYEPEVAPPPPKAIPLGVLFVGVTAALVGAVLTITSLGLYLVRDEAPYRWGYPLLAIVSAFGLYASIRLLKGRSAHLLITALMLGMVIDLVALIILPIALPAMAAPTTSPEPPETVAPSSPGPDQPEEWPRGPVIRPLTERIDWRKVSHGLLILFVTAAAAAYLNSGQVHRYTTRH